MKVIDWYPTLNIFLKEIKIRNGVPLGCMFRPTNAQGKSVYDNFIDEYVDKAPLVVHAFTSDAAELRTYTVRFTSGNMFAEANMVAHEAESNSGFDLMALKYHYEGIGVNAVNTVQADNALKKLFY